MFYGVFVIAHSCLSLLLTMSYLYHTTTMVVSIILHPGATVSRKTCAEVCLNHALCGNCAVTGICAESVSDFRPGAVPTSRRAVLP